MDEFDRLASLAREESRERERVRQSKAKREEMVGRLSDNSREVARIKEELASLEARLYACRRAQEALRQDIITLDIEENRK